jgi:choline dehydrogenase-like flavoprotein
VIFDHRHLRRDLAIAADLCVIGSGAGGAPVAWEAARAGKRVVVLEAGSLVTPRDMVQLEHEMLPRLYHDAGGRMTANKEVHVHQGKGVGGSTLHNLNLVKRVPDPVLDEWRADYGLDALGPEAMDALYAEVEERLSVSRLDDSHLNANNRVLMRGVEALGYRGGFLSHNRRGCMRSGFCELGCPFDAKENALKVFLADAVEQGAEVLADTWATAIEWSGRRAAAVRATVRDPANGAELAEVHVTARAICLSASATGTPVLIRRSQLPDPHQHAGTRLHLHPGAAVAGVFDEPIHAWTGIPQSYECTEWLDFERGGRGERRVWIVPSFAHPAGVASMLRGFGDEHASWMRLYPNLAALSPMLHDVSRGRVAPTRNRFGVRVDYWLGEDDRAALKRGLFESARLLLAAGARRVVVPFSAPLELHQGVDLDRAFAPVEIRRHDLAITSVHPMSSAWMSQDPARGPVDPFGRWHWLDNLFVSDTSLYPTSIGVPPQLTAYALGLHVGRRILAEL